MVLCWAQACERAETSPRACSASTAGAQYPPHAVRSCAHQEEPLAGPRGCVKSILLLTGAIRSHYCSIFEANAQPAAQSLQTGLAHSCRPRSLVARTVKKLQTAPSRVLICAMLELDVHASQHIVKPKVRLSNRAGKNNCRLLVLEGQGSRASQGRLRSGHRE